LERYDHWSRVARQEQGGFAETSATHVDPDAFLIGVVSRLPGRRADLLLDVLPQLMRGRAQLALLGAGDEALEEGFAAAEAAHPAVGVHIGYSEEPRMIQAGVDAFSSSR
jgi:starch synthase